jgi:hypothetical protein
MAERTIDYNRPTIIRVLGRLNMEVFMYKDDPGNYLNAYGHPVPIEFAEEAGYDIHKLENARRKSEALGLAAQAINEEYSSNVGQRTVVAEHGGFKVVMLTKGRHIVEDSDGNNLTPGTILTQEVADGVAKSLSAEMAKRETARTEAKKALGERSGRGRGTAGGTEQPRAE